MAPNNNGWDARKLLDMYIHDYLLKKNLNVAAHIFKQEANVGEIDCVMDESPDGFLRDWWSIFYDTYTSRIQHNRASESSSTSSTSRQLLNISNNSFQQQNAQVSENGVMMQPHSISPIDMLLSTGNLDQNVITPLQENVELGAFSFGLKPNSTVAPSGISQYQHSSMIPGGSSGNQFAFSWQNNILAPLEGNAEFGAFSFGVQPNSIVGLNQNQQSSMIPGGSSFNFDKTNNTFVGESSTYLRTSKNKTEIQDGIPFKEFGILQPCHTEITCCHFSTDGKFLVGSGIGKKIFIWNVANMNWIGINKEHDQIVTDIRFKPSSSIFATSCFDNTIHIWDASKPYHCISRLLGHSDPVVSLDFHPKTQEILCSSDTRNEIRLWNTKQSICTHIFKGPANTSVRFQPRSGNLLAAASQNTITIIDVDTNFILQILEGHEKNIRSICWDTSGKYIGSVSEDSARIWSTSSGGKCIYELRSYGKKYESCIFHPAYSLLLVLGGYQTIELWNPAVSEKTNSILAHNGVIGALADSPETELIASASYDQLVKLWK